MLSSHYNVVAPSEGRTRVVLQRSQLAPPLVERENRFGTECRRRRAPAPSRTECADADGADSDGTDADAQCTADAGAFGATDAAFVCRRASLVDDACRNGTSVAIVRDSFCLSSIRIDQPLRSFSLTILLAMPSAFPMQQTHIVVEVTSFLLWHSLFGSK